MKIITMTPTASIFCIPVILIIQVIEIVKRGFILLILVKIRDSFVLKECAEHMFFGNVSKRAETIRDSFVLYKFAENVFWQCIAVCPELSMFYVFSHWGGGGVVRLGRMVR